MVVRWLGAFALYGVALGARVLLGRVYGGVPALTFYPVILMVSVLFGWRQALAVLVLSVISGLYLFFPPGMYLLPLGWLFVGGLTIAIITALNTLAQELADANERQRILFQELQHRVANTLQSMTGTLTMARRKIDPAPEEAKTLLDEGIRRIGVSADVHRRLHDPALFDRNLGSIVKDAVMTVIDAHSTKVSLDMEDIRLSFDQMSIVTMLVIEFANNAQKHVFQRGLGSRFMVSLKAFAGNRAVLTVKDDGPGRPRTNTENDHGTLGHTILRGLARQLGGNFSEKLEEGTEVTITFPIPPRDKTTVEPVFSWVERTAR